MDKAIFEKVLIEDSDTARVGAEAERPYRDDILKDPDISKEEEAIVLKFAQRVSEKAMKEYEIDKERRPIERLISFIDNTVLEMKKKGLGEDAEILEKVKSRITRYSEIIRDKKRAYESSLNEVALASSLKYDQKFRISDKIPVTDKLGDGGGQVYQDDYIHRDGSWVIPEDVSYVLSHMEDGKEFINFHFSDDGETEFFRALGALEKNQKAIDIPQIYQKMINEGGKQFNYKFMDSKNNN